MKDHWFVPKYYGYGCYPVTWQGWLSLLVLCGLVLIAFYVDIPIGESTRDATVREILRFALDLLLILVLFLHLASGKTEGGLKWRWGQGT